ncbi:acetolactate synthase large subunit, partial [Pseudomonas sp. RW405]
SRSTHSAWWLTSVVYYRPKASSPWTTASTRSGSPATTKRTSQTPC